MEIRELLPIGSVVLLKDGRKKVMICGVKQTDNSTDIEYDYISVLYPEGYVGDGSQFLFNHGDIDQIFFKGYEDNEREDFINRLDAYYKNNNV